MNLIYSEQFLQDLGAVLEYIKKDNPQAARAFKQKILEKARLLKKYPELGKNIDDPRLPGIRILIIGNYLALYEIKKDEQAVHLHTFCHGARDYPNLYKRLKSNL